MYAEFCQYVMANFCQCYWQCLANPKAKSCHTIGSVLPIQRQNLANSVAPQKKLTKHPLIQISASNDENKYDNRQ